MLVRDARAFHKITEAKTAAGTGTKEEKPKKGTQGANLMTAKKPASVEEVIDMEI